ncbi:hypothetical protein SeLEV6574_g06401 [Synchytrium endobioticum]|nr:hypothetical protein SeLEV6574_g06401 [Synchytrium endobioticum]
MDHLSIRDSSTELRNRWDSENASIGTIIPALPLADTAPRPLIMPPRTASQPSSSVASRDAEARRSQIVDAYSTAISRVVSSSIQEIDVHVVRVRAGQAELSKEVTSVFHDLHKKMLSTTTPEAQQSQIQIEQGLSRLALVRKRLVSVNASLASSHTRLEKSMTTLSARTVR